MAAKAKRGGTGETAKARPGKPRDKQSYGRKKSCYFCEQHVEEVDYKNVAQLRRFISDRAKIRSPRMTGNCRRHQRQVAVAIKRAREIALLPYVTEGGPPPRARSSRS